MQVTKQTQRTPEEQENRRKYWRERQSTMREKYSQMAKDWRKIPKNRLKQLLKAKGRWGNRRDLNYEDCLQRLNKNEWRCEVTGKPFNFDIPRHPLSMSIDRIDATKPYTLDNIRFVCWWLNCAMGSYGLNELKNNIKDWIMPDDQ